MNKLFFILLTVALFVPFVNAQTRIYRLDLLSPTTYKTTTTTLPQIQIGIQYGQPIDHVIKKAPFAGKVTIATGNVIALWQPWGNVYMAAIDNSSPGKDEVEIVFTGTIIGHPGETAANTGKLKAKVVVRLEKDSMLKNDHGEILFFIRMVKIETDGRLGQVRLPGTLEYIIEIDPENMPDHSTENYEVISDLAQFPGKFYVETGFRLKTIDYGQPNGANGGVAVLAGGGNYNNDGNKIESIEIQQVPK